jgi:hypothetical protein
LAKANTRIFGDLCSDSKVGAFAAIKQITSLRCDASDTLNVGFFRYASRLIGPKNTSDDVLGPNYERAVLSESWRGVRTVENAFADVVES